MNFGLASCAEFSNIRPISYLHTRPMTEDVGLFCLDLDISNQILFESNPGAEGRKLY